MSDKAVRFVTIGLLSAILFVAGFGLYSYQRELRRKANESCDKAHSDFQDALAGPDWPYTTPKLEKEIKAACDGKTLTPEEAAALQRRKDELHKAVQEAMCEDDLRRYGVTSAVSNRDCPGTKIGKKAGF